jgi:hypothetical protein
MVKSLKRGNAKILKKYNKLWRFSETTAFKAELRSNKATAIMLEQFLQKAKLLDDAAKAEATAEFLSNYQQ